MIDFHSHILPNIDDGSTNMQESIKLIKEAEQVGFTGIVSTSHYLENYFECGEKERKKLLNDLEDKIESNKAVNVSKKIQLYLGSEIYVTQNMIELLKEGKASSINGTKYVLFELPMNSKPLFVKEIVYKLIENGYKPVIAHPERYSYVKEDITYVEELKKMGALFQANYGSVIGMYGIEAKKTIKKLLKKDLISFLGSDVHRAGQIYPKIPKILKKLEKWTSTEKLEELTTLNAKKVLESEKTD